VSAAYFALEPTFRERKTTPSPFHILDNHQTCHNRRPPLPLLGSWSHELVGTISVSLFTLSFSLNRTNLSALLGYGPSGERLVAGIVALSEDKYYVLLIQSNSGRSWVLPKGGWETDEATAQEAACREAWEEAGVVCKVNFDLGTIVEKRGANIKAEYHFYEATVERLENEWPEMHKRTRAWMSFKQAEAALQTRPELLEALKRCTMIR
jgi:diphosphoinositol-polyphosphate diphosphatase